MPRDLYVVFLIVNQHALTVTDLMLVTRFLLLMTQTYISVPWLLTPTTVP
jgi:hypothetical protein